MEELSQTQFIKRFSWVNIPWVRNMLGLGTLLMLFICSWLSYNVAHKYRMTLKLSQEQAALKTQEISHALATDLSRLVLAANTLSENLRENALSEQSVRSALKKSVLNHNGFYAVGVAFDSYQLSAQQRLFSPFVRQEGNTYIFDRVDNYYDYVNGGGQNADKAENWFVQAKKGKIGWLQPFFDKVHNRVVLKYITPVSKKGYPDQVMGVAFLDIDLDWIRQQVENHDVGDNGYAIIVNEYNQVLYHGLKGSLKVADSLGEVLSPGFIADFKSGQLGENELTGNSAWLHRYPIDDTGWYVLTVMSVAHNDKQLFDDRQERQVIHKSDLIIWIVNMVIFCLFAYLWIVIIKRQLSVARLWQHSFIASSLFAIGIIAVLLCQHYSSSPVLDNSLILSNRAVVDGFKQEYAIASLEEYKEAPLYIPTGLFIQSIEFLNATNVAITGYLWQRYPKEYEESIQHGVIFPEAIQTTMDESYEKEQAGQIIKGWYFETTLRELFDYEEFPFDRQSVWIRVWHRDFSDNVILVPDFESYDSLNPRALPGIENDFVLSGWELSRTYYDMRINTYNTNFGKAGFKSRDKTPELYFNIELSRNFLNPFIAHLFPLVVVLLMLFAIMVTISRNETRKELFGFDVSTIIASCSALFFVVLIAHVQLRDTLSTNSIVYLEYYYLISYIIILLITVNSILFSWDVPVRFLKFQDNLIPKLVYWPLLLASSFVCTVILFQ